MSLNEDAELVRKLLNRKDEMTTTERVQVQKAWNDYVCSNRPMPERQRVWLRKLIDRLSPQGGQPAPRMKRMIVVVTTERDPKTNREIQVVSHGVDEESGRIVVLPCEKPGEIGAKFDQDIMEYVIDQVGRTP